MRHVVCIGDSIVEGEGDELNLGGWVGRLAAKLGPNRPGEDGYRVYNLGIQGNTIRDVNYRLGEALVRNPDILILGCGGNDVKTYLLPDGSRERCLAQDQVEKNWHQVLAKGKALTPKFLVLGGHNIRDSQASAEVQIRHQDKARHMTWVGSVCAEMNIAFMPQIVYEKMEDMFSHGSHPSAAGYDIYVEHVFRQLQKLDWI